MGVFNRWARKKEKDEAKEKKAAALVKSQEVKKEKTENKKETILEKETRPAGVNKESVAKNAYRVLIHPVVTEKSTYLQSEGAYIFEVFPSATKVEIKKAVQALYKVKVVGVRIVNLKGKQVRFGRMEGERKNRKKAIVTLQKGQAIELHKNV